MATTLQPYDVNHYNSLPNLHDAKQRFDQSKATEVLFKEIGPSHLFLEPNEMLVSTGPVAVPWDRNSGAKQLGQAHLSAWRFTEAGLRPYEFTHGGAQVPMGGIQAFLEELRDILVSHGLIDVLGVCSVREGSMHSPSVMEFASGRANITLLFDIAPNDGGAIDAMWQFGFWAA